MVTAYATDTGKRFQVWGPEDSIREALVGGPQNGNDDYLLMQHEVDCLIDFGLTVEEMSDDDDTEPTR